MNNGYIDKARQRLKSNHGYFYAKWLKAEEEQQKRDKLEKKWQDLKEHLLTKK